MAFTDEMIRAAVEAYIRHSESAKLLTEILIVRPDKIGKADPPINPLGLRARPSGESHI